ncbi:hypothetical protein [Sinorhizobium meliloti]|uniref:hypothetical protein n=1 Tax=Rhizobium meliloti TaxID=382 RepID=UPI001AEBA747|nr:hypothetical protein [Sinorhizobium meliloti]UDU21177.1 hypothetical protein LJD24_18660 [Sinorhizobium meliloti]
MVAEAARVDRGTGQLPGGLLRSFTKDRGRLVLEDTRRFMATAMVSGSEDRTSRTQSRKPASLGDHRAQSFQAVELSPKRGIFGQQLKVFFFERHLASIRLRLLFPNSFGLLQPRQVRFAVAIVGVAEDFGATRIGAEDLPVKAAFLGDDTFVQIDAVSRKRLVLVPFQVFDQGIDMLLGDLDAAFAGAPRHQVSLRDDRLMTLAAGRLPICSSRSMAA